MYNINVIYVFVKDYHFLLPETLRAGVIALIMSKKDIIKKISSFIL